MPIKKNTSSTSILPELTSSFDEAFQQIQDRERKGAELLFHRPHSREQLGKLQNQFTSWNEYNVAMLLRMFSTDSIANQYRNSGLLFFDNSHTFGADLEELVANIRDRIHQLEAIRERLPLYIPPEKTVVPSKQKKISMRENEVFVVHGRNNEVRETVARFLLQLHLKPIILHEQANAGMTLIEKFEVHADSRFAVVLLTADDVGGLRNTESIDKLGFRARQNVIFELGFFVGKLGRRNVCALVAEGVELPSDVDGIVYVKLDPHGAWRMQLARELRAAGVEVDLNQVI
jgi:predicted nucleotide-binding protein